MGFNFDTLNHCQTDISQGYAPHVIHPESIFILKGRTLAFMRSLIFFLCLLTVVGIVSATSLPNENNRNSILSDILYRHIVTAQKSSFYDVNRTSSKSKGIQIQTITTIPVTNGNQIAKLLANSLENTLNKSATILEITSKLPEVKSVSYATSISPKLHGIPKDVDIAKREVAQAILTADKDFKVIFFLMPNGTIYLDEPYSLQTNLTKNNYAYRDYYRGAIETQNTYLGNILISTSTGLPTPFMSVPIYSSENNKNNSTLIGIWAGGLNLRILNKSLQSLNLTNNNNDRIVYVDQHGQKLADSNKVLANYYNESFANLQSFKNAIAGKSGSIIEVVNGTKMIVFYHPIKFHSTTWAIVLMQREG